MPEHPSANGTPLHSDVRFEPKDADAGGVVWFGVGLIVFLAAGLGVLFALLLLLNALAEADKPGPSPLANRNGAQVSQPLPDEKTMRWSGDNLGSAGSKLAPLPRLEGIDIEHPEHTIGRLHESTALEQRRREDAWLNSGGRYRLTGGTKDEELVRIPIEDAMKRLAGNLPARQRAIPEEAWLRSPTSTSSGRVPTSGTRDGGAP